MRGIPGVLAVALFSLLCASPAMASTLMFYGPPNAAPGALSGHSVSGGAGTLPNDYPAPTPWNLAAGDYCTAYKFAQPGAPTTSAPLLAPSDTDIGGLTGFDPPLPRQSHQLRHNDQADSSTCQASGTTWGFWANADTADNYCSSWCGVRHDYSTGQSTTARPWANSLGINAKLVMSAFRNVQMIAGNVGWSYICAMLHDTTTAQRLEYCLRVWRSWGGAPYDVPIVFRDPYIGSGGAGFAAVVSDITATGTPYAQNWGGALTVLLTQPSSGTYAAAITRAHLVNAINDTNTEVKSANWGFCSGLINRVKCYSTDPDKYALFGVEDGLEFQGSGVSYSGGYSNGLVVYSDF
jgi:hypothetical protein